MQPVRNLIYGPGFQGHNIAVSKSFRVSETHNVQFRGEAYDWPNHANWRSPSTDILNPSSSTFGKVTGKQNERQIQLSLRYSF
jgi:hypothetical protein